MKILLILNRFNIDPFIYDKDSTAKMYTYLMPMGLGYISAVLKRKGYDVDLLNLNHIEGTCEKIISDKVSKTFYDFILNGGVSIYYPNIRDYITYIRKASPRSTIIVGGGMVSAQPEIMFNLLKADYGVISEGEQTVLELIECLTTNGNKNTVDGIIFKDLRMPENKIETIITKPRQPIMDLDALPYPDFEGFEYKEFLEHTRPTYIAYDAVDVPRMYPLLGSRSCPLKCTFCYHTIGNKYRHRSIDNILTEMKFAIDTYGVNIFFFYDELFAYDKERALDFCTKLRALMDTVPYKIWVNLNLRVDCAEEEVIDALKTINCNPIGLGLESYSQTILDSMKKHTTPEQIKKTLTLISSKDIATQGAFIFGDPAETLETAQETLDFFINHQDLIGSGVSIGFVIPFQGSPLYHYCVKSGIIKDEIAFIEDRAKNGYSFSHPINMTKLSDSDFEILKDRVFTAFYTAGYYAIPKIKVVDGKDEFHINCPYCKKESVVKNINRPKMLELPTIGCRHCLRRFMLVTPYYPIIRAALKVFGFNKLYVIKSGLRKIKMSLIK